VKLKDIGEFGFIGRISRDIRPGSGVVAGIGDDAAVLASDKKGFYSLFTCDMYVEKVHFTKKDVTPYQLGWKAMAGNISDIAAMGGLPRHAVVSIGLTGDEDVRYCDEIYRGMRAAAKPFKVDIVGGDTVTSPEGIVISVAMTGVVEEKMCVYRSGARQGEAVLVTGSLGGSLLKKHCVFAPRVREARFIAGTGRVSAMMDVTDGLVADLEKICAASGVGAMLFEELIPVSPDARRMKGEKTPLESALSDGEDFELLCVVPREAVAGLLKAFNKKFSVPLTLIGGTTDAKGIRVYRTDGTVDEPRYKGYDHFKSGR